MRNLKFLGVLLVSFMVIGLNVNAEVIEKDFVLQEDSTEFIEVAENANVTIDLNGKTLDVSATNNDAIIINKGAIVTITGEGKVFAKQAAVFNKGGNVTIENGSYDASVWYTIKNLGTMFINGGTFTQSNENKGDSSLIVNGWAGNAVNDKNVEPPKSTETEAKAFMTINGGIFKHNAQTSTIKSDDWSKTIINGGDFESLNGTLVQATGEAIVNGGKFLGYNNLALFFGTGDEGYEPAILNIKGGEFTSKYIIWTYTSGTLDISGGVFKGIEEVRNPREVENKYDINITGGKFNLNIEDLLSDENYRIQQLDKEEFIVQTKLNVLVSKIEGDGDVRFDKELAFPGDTITMKYSPLEGYKFESVEVLDCNGKKVEVNDNKFIMPETDVKVIVKFKEIVKEEVKEESKDKLKGEPKVEVTVPDKESTVLVGNEEKTENVLLESLAKNDKYKDLNVKVLVVSEEVKATEEITKEFKESLTKEKIENAKIVNFFDISIQVKNKVSEKIEGYLTELTEKITFTVELPELDKVKEGYNRKYYVIKKHNDKIEILDAKVSEDGKSITFETDEFSTYALAYEDVENSGDVEALPSIPQTFDGIAFTLFIFTISLIGFVSVSKYFKKQLNK